MPAGNQHRISRSDGPALGAVLAHCSLEEGGRLQGCSEKGQPGAGVLGKVRAAICHSPAGEISGK